MSELSKCLQGKQFNCIDDELVSIITKAHRLTKQYNQTKFEDTIQKDNILSELFAKIGNNLTYSPCLKAGDFWIQTILAY